MVTIGQLVANSWEHQREFECRGQAEGAECGLSLSHSGRKLVGVRVVVRSPSLLPRSLAYLLLLPHAAHIYIAFRSTCRI